MNALQERMTENYRLMQKGERDSALARLLQIPRTTEEMIAELSALCGLNVREREEACQKVG